MKFIFKSICVMNIFINFTIYCNCLSKSLLSLSVPTKKSSKNNEPDLDSIINKFKSSLFKARYGIYIKDNNKVNIIVENQSLKKKEDSYVIKFTLSNIEGFSLDFMPLSKLFRHYQFKTSAKINICLGKSKNNSKCKSSVEIIDYIPYYSDENNFNNLIKFYNINKNHKFFKDFEINNIENPKDKSIKKLYLKYALLKANYPTKDLIKEKYIPIFEYEKCKEKNNIKCLKKDEVLDFFKNKLDIFINELNKLYL